MIKHSLYRSIQKDSVIQMTLSELEQTVQHALENTRYDYCKQLARVLEPTSKLTEKELYDKLIAYTTFYEEANR